MWMSLRVVLLSLAAAVLCSSVLWSAPLRTVSERHGSQEQQPNTYLIARKGALPSNASRVSDRSVALVHNVRMREYPDFTRVVFDLERAVTFTQTRREKPVRVIIELKNTTLSTAAKTMLTAREFPDAVTVFQPHSRAVRVSLDLERLRDYKLLSLTHPPRLVVDVFPTPGQNGRRPGTNGTEPFTPLPPPDVQRHIKTIVIDPGHGGKDPGAVGRSGTREKVIALKVGLFLRDMLRKRLGKTVYMTRTRDVFVDLEGRADFANNNNADLFISIHLNSHPKRNVKGIELYHFGEASDPRALEVAARENGIDLESGSIVGQIVADKITDMMIEESLEFAWTTRKSMVRHIKTRYKVVDHGVKTAPFYVLRFTTMPSILAEIGFLSNRDEERQMRTTAYQRHMAEAIYRGIKAYVDAVQPSAR